LLNEQLFKRYPVGTGKFGKTPAVDFYIYDKIIEPPWTRPADNRLIEYGDPENVLGTRWMALKSAENSSLKGFGIHGTWERDSIGAQSSAGCVRMFNEDVEELFDLVPRKSRVTIEE
jgi:lipoprotein-anchoring transpeptidase ErfK/SrfK